MVRFDLDFFGGLFALLFRLTWAFDLGSGSTPVNCLGSGSTPVNCLGSGNTPVS
jgi:hypothetical protein